MCANIMNASSEAFMLLYTYSKYWHGCQLSIVGCIFDELNVKIGIPAFLAQARLINSESHVNGIFNTEAAAAKIKSYLHHWGIDVP